jgi:hypothetical protein
MISASIFSGTPEDINSFGADGSRQQFGCGSHLATVLNPICAWR